MAWRPQDEGLQQICYLLSDFQKPGTNQAQILSQLEQCKSFPDFNNYLATVFAQGTTLPDEVRQSAGLLLKNNLREQFASASDENKTFIKGCILPAMGDKKRMLRQTAGTTIAVIVTQGGLGSWPQLLQAMQRCLESSDPDALDGTLDALYKVVEEAPMQLDMDVSGMQGTPNSLLIPRLLHLFRAPLPKVQVQAVSILNLLAGGMPEPLANSLDEYLQGLFSLATSEQAETRKAVCTGIVQMVHLQPDRLAPQLPAIIEYMLQSTQDADEGVALEACEFWSACCEVAADAAMLRPVLPKLIPVLLGNMVYKEDDEEVLEAQAGEAEPSDAEDRDQELKPFIQRGGGHGEEDEEDGGEEVSRWNLRKCSAAGLDVLSTVFGDEILPIVVPIVQQRLQDWKARESGILALGAISEGCASGLLHYLADMVSALLPLLTDTRPLVRSITCWALSRYSRWIVDNGREPQSQGQRQMEAVIQGFLGRVLDHNKRVQEAACSALASLEEAIGQDAHPGLLLPYLRPILETLGRACSTYGRRNLRMLYDALSTLADMVGRPLAQPDCIQLFMPPLLQRWQTTEDTDRELLPLLEVFTTIAQALGQAFQPYAESIFERCLRLAATQLAVKQGSSATPAANSKSAEQPEQQREFIIGALDLISGMAEGLGPSIEPLIERANLRDLLLQCCQDASPDVRQSAFALVGDLSKVCPGHLLPCTRQLVTLAVANLQPHNITQENMSACNNACWSLGELAMKITTEQLQPYAATIVEHLVPILAAPTGAMPRSILENSAITLGRVAWICPDVLAPHLGSFTGVWCASLRNIRDDVEKEHAFLGLCAMLRINPQGALPGFVGICEAVTSWRHIRDEGLLNEMIQIMQLYKQHLTAGGMWQQALNSLPRAVRDKLTTLCHL